MSNPSSNPSGDPDRFAPWQKERWPEDDDERLEAPPDDAPENDDASLYDDYPEALAECDGEPAKLTYDMLGTWLLIGASAGVFIAMLASGVSFWSPLQDDVMNWGASYVPAIFEGEAWRLITASFVHAGIIHIAINLHCLVAVGPLVERLIGTTGMLITFLACGIVGHLAMATWLPDFPSFGSFPGLVGMMGVLGAISLLKPNVYWDLQLRETWWRCAINLLASMALSYYSAGFALFPILIATCLAGLLCGLIFSRGLLAGNTHSRWHYDVAVVSLLTILCAGGYLASKTSFGDGLPYFAAWSQFKSADVQMLAGLEKKIDLHNTGKMTQPQVALAMDQELLVPWRKAAAQVGALPPAPARLAEKHAAVLQYVDSSQKAWELFIKAFREGSKEEAMQSMQMLVEAREALVAAGGY